MAPRVNPRAPLRVFVGTSANGEDAEACAVFEYTLRKNASVDVEIAWMALSRDPASAYYSDPVRDAGWRTDRWATPWSGFRWAVPALCGWRGRAVYFDCPQIVVGDVASLHELEMSDDNIVAANHGPTFLRTACLVWNCAPAKKWLPSIEELRTQPDQPQTIAHQLVHKPRLCVDLPPGWAVPDAEFSADPSSAVGSVYCENPHMQPHTRHALTRLRRQGLEHWFEGTRLPHYCQRLVEMFDQLLEEARAAGYEPERYVPEERHYEVYAIGGVDGADLRRMERAR